MIAGATVTPLMTLALYTAGGLAAGAVASMLGPGDAAPGGDQRRALAD